MKDRPLIAILSLSLVFTALNSFKPLHVDDYAYYRFAAHIAEHPLDPYGFEYAEGVPAHHVLAPPVALYWLAAGMRLGITQPFGWKLWMLPFGVLFVFALHRLFQRFARGLELPLLAMTVLSPAYLPGWNLMLDIPALGLGLFALTTFLDACDSKSIGWTVLAGLLAGLALETKYSAFTIPAAMLLYAILNRQPKLGVVAAANAALLFVAWEAWTATLYGESHFLYSLHQRDGQFWTRIARLALPLVGILGGVMPALGLLGLSALRVPRTVVWAVATAFGVGYTLIVCVPESAAVFLRDPVNGKGRLILNQLVFGTSGVLVCAVAAAAAWRLCRTPWWFRGVRFRRVDWFLVGWLALEVGGYLALSPFPAARRVMGVVAVATLLVSRLAARTCRTPERVSLVRHVALAGVILGFGYFAVDWREASAAKGAAEDAARWATAQAGRATVWYQGPWAYQFYAERAGLRPLRSGGATAQPGDWLVVGELDTPMPFARDRWERVTELLIHDALPLRMMPCYYGGRTALEHHEGPRFRSIIYRVRADARPAAVETSH